MKTLWLVFTWLLFLPVSVISYLWCDVKIAWNIGREWRLSKEQKEILRKARGLK